MTKSVALVLILVGLVLVLVGVVAWFGGLSWFGRLPGDIRIESGDTRFYFPIVSMLLVSVVLSVIVSLARRLLG